MKYLILFLLFTSICYAQTEVTRDQLKSEVVQIKALSQKQKIKLDSARTSLQTVQKVADDNREWGIAQSNRADIAEAVAVQEKQRADKEHQKAVQNGRERDVFVILFALAGAIATVSILVPMMNKWFNIQFPWTIIAPIIVFIAFFGLYFGLVRLALHFITNLI